MKHIIQHLIVFSLIILVEFMLPPFYTYSNDNVRHCMYQADFISDYHLEKPGLPYFLFYLFPVCNDLVLKLMAVLVAFTIYIIVYMRFGFWKALLPLFYSELLFPTGVFGPVGLHLYSAALQPGRVWLWFRPWSIGFLLLAILLYSEDKWLKRIAGFIGYHFHPPTVIAGLVFQRQVYTVAVLGAWATIYLFSGYPVWATITFMTIIGALLFDKLYGKAVDIIESDYTRILLAVLPAFSVLFKPVWWSSLIVYANPLYLLLLYKWEKTATRTKTILLYVVLWGYLAIDGFTLPVGRFTPLLTLFALPDIDDGEARELLSASAFNLPAYLLLLHAYK